MDELYFKIFMKSGDFEIVPISKPHLPGQLWNDVDEILYSYIVDPKKPNKLIKQVKVL